MSKRNKKGNLSKNPNGHSFCGPAALTVLTGRTYESVVKSIRKCRRERGRPAGNTRRSADGVAGMYNSEMSRVLNALGYKMSGFTAYHPNFQLLSPRTNRGTTLRQYMRKTHGKRGKLWLLVQTTRHYLVIRGNRIWDSTMNGVTIKKATHKRGIIKHIWVVQRYTKSQRERIEASRKRDAKRKKEKIRVLSEPIWTDVFNLKKGGDKQ